MIKTVKMASKPAVGIDLGTSYSVIAVYRNDSIEIIPNDQGNRLTPSYVGFTPHERIIGQGAYYQAHLHPENTIYGKELKMFVVIRKNYFLKIFYSCKTFDWSKF